MRKRHLILLLNLCNYMFEEPREEGELAPECPGLGEEALLLSVLPVKQGKVSVGENNKFQQQGAWKQ